MKVISSKQLSDSCSDNLRKNPKSQMAGAFGNRLRAHGLWGTCGSGAAAQ